MYLWLKRWEDNGDVVSFKSSGRPRKTSAAQDRQIVNSVVSNGFVRIQDISSSHCVSTSTIRRRLRTAGLRHRVPARKPLLSARHKEQRLQFAREYLNYDFSRAIFSDEKVFVSSADGRLSLWRPNNTRYLERNILPSRRSGRISFGVWGWMSASGPGELAEISGRMNSEQYTSILDEVLLPSLNVYFPELMPIDFVQDNSGVHNSRFTQAWFSRNRNFVNSLPWPPKSPDLNPIENLWGLMVQEWDSNQARTREALVRHVHEIWDSFRGNNVCYNMVSSMQERLQDVINAEGGYTRF